MTTSKLEGGTILFQTPHVIVRDYQLTMHVAELSYPHRDVWVEGEHPCAKLRANIAHLQKADGNIAEYLYAKFFDAQEIK